MFSRPGEVVGIDLGTTSSAIAVVIDGQPEIVPDADGRLMIPSIVSWSGEAAIASSKRLIGRSYADVSKCTSSRALFASLKPLPDGTAGVGQRSPVDVATRILQTLLAQAEAACGVRAERAVIGVPANFLEAQREATLVAAKQAGLDKVRLIEEPVAAALAYGVGRADEEELVVVFDLGGGTLDVSVLRCGGGLWTQTLNRLRWPARVSLPFPAPLLASLAQERLPPGRACEEGDCVHPSSRDPACPPRPRLRAGAWQAPRRSSRVPHTHTCTYLRVHMHTHARTGTAEVLSSAGEATLGGDDFDVAIARYLGKRHRLLDERGQPADERSPALRRVARSLKERCTVVREARAPLPPELSLADSAPAGGGAGGSADAAEANWAGVARAEGADEVKAGGADLGLAAEEASMTSPTLLTLSRSALEAAGTDLLQQMRQPVIKACSQAQVSPPPIRSMRMCVCVCDTHIYTRVHIHIHTHAHRGLSSA